MEDLLISIVLAGSGVTQEQFLVTAPRFEIMMGKSYTDRFKRDNPRQYVYAIIDLAKQSQKLHLIK